MQIEWTNQTITLKSTHNNFQQERLALVVVPIEETPSEKSESSLNQNAEKTLTELPNNYKK